MTRPAARPGPLLILVAIGTALRVAALAIPSVHHPDEIYQYLEAAHRLVFGYGVVPWEYRLGIRSWLFPLLLAGPMAAGSVISPGSGLYVLLPRLAMALVSTTIIISAWMMGARTSPRHAFFAALAATIWFELIGFAAHPLGETAGLAAACGAAALMFGPKQSRAHWIIAGALLALASVLRFQYAPALLVLACWGGGREISARWMPMALGAAAVLIASSLVDLASGAWPFAWLVENVRQNLLLGRATAYGEAGPLTYIGVLGGTWRWASIPLLIAAYAGVKRQPALFWAALVHLVLHSMIAHKEYRFVLLSSGFAVILAGIGTADIVHWAQQRIAPRWRYLVPCAAMSGWAIASLVLATGAAQRPFWTSRSAATESFADLRSTPGLCGVAVLGLPMPEFGGYTVLHRRVPIYLLDVTYPHEQAAAARLVGGYNAIVATPLHQREIPPGYTLDRCRSTAGEYADPVSAAAIRAVCTYHRAGPCSADARRAGAALEINRAIAERGM